VKKKKQKPGAGASYQSNVEEKGAALANGMTKDHLSKKV